MAKTVEDFVKKATKRTITELKKIGESIYKEGIKTGLRNIAEEAVEIAKQELRNTDPKFTSQQLTPQDAAKEVQAVYDETNNSVSIVASLDYSKRNAMYFLEYGAGLSSKSPDHSRLPWVYKVRHQDNVHEKLSYGAAMEDLHSFQLYKGKKGSLDRSPLVDLSGNPIKMTVDRSYANQLSRAASSKYNYDTAFTEYQQGGRSWKPRKPKDYDETDYETKIFVYKGQTYGITLSSKAIGYMRSARNYINENASRKMAASISVFITNRTNRPRPIYSHSRINDLTYKVEKIYIHKKYEPSKHIKDIY